MYKQLFIGLGGQGARTICEIRKVMYDLELNAKAADGAAADSDEYKPFPCAYLSIDSSSDIWDQKSDWLYKGKDLSLEPIEMCQLTVPPAEVVKSANIAPWIFSKDPKKYAEQKPICDSLILSKPQGAAQKRRYGRVLFAANEAKILTSINNAHDRAIVAGGDGIDACVINVFCSLGGGTGSGGIVDLIAMLRERFPQGQNLVDAHTAAKQYPINVFLYISDVTGNHNVGFFFENQYAALRDLNAMATGLMRPHSLASNPSITQTYEYGKRIKFNPDFENPMDAIILSANTNNLNRATPIAEQIKNVAKWSVSRAILTTRGGAAMKIATGEDMRGQFPGEPNTTCVPAMVERSFLFSSLGESKWQAPVNELRLMAVNSILANSFRQMLYNNLSSNEGYKSIELPLDDKSKAAYTSHLVTDSFLLTENVLSGWREWAENPANTEMQAIMNATWDAEGRLALSRMEKLFKDYYEGTVKLEKSMVAGDNLSLPGRMAAMRSGLANKLGRQNSQATSIYTLLHDDLMTRLVEAWENGSIGLKQAASIVEFVMEAAEDCRTALQSLYNAKKDGSTEQAPFVASLDDRNNPRTGQWLKLTSVSFKIKGKAFLDAHKEDLISRYAIMTQCAHIENAREQLELFIRELSTFSGNLAMTIKAMEDYEKERREECESLPLRKFIMVDSEKPRMDERLLYAYNSSDSKVKDLVNAIDTECRSHEANIEMNAKAIRAIVADSIEGGHTLAHIFKALRVVDASTKERAMKSAYGLANRMLTVHDRNIGSKMMGGIVERISNMGKADFSEQFKELLYAATFSYLRDASADADGFGLAQAIRKSWLISFPNSIDLSNQGIALGTSDTDKCRNLKQLALNVLGGDATAEDVIVSLEDNDNTQISVWQTEYSQPARNAAVVVKKLRDAYNKKMREAALRDTFWINIDDTVTEMAADLAYPDAEMLRTIREAAMWIAENSPCFSVEGEPKRVYRKGSSLDDDAIYEDNPYTAITDRAVLDFATNLRDHLYTCCLENRGLLQDLVQKYEAVLASENREERVRMKPLVDKFIKPTAFRIAQFGGMPDVFPLHTM